MELNAAALNPMLKTLELQARAIEWLYRLPLPRHSKLPKHLQTGVRGEREALWELRRQGYTVVARRWTSGLVRGDVDLIGWQGERLCFVEVKTRTARDNSPAESAVNEQKKRMLRALARVYLRGFPQQLRGSILIRFDVVSVYLLSTRTEIEILPAAFPID